MLAVLHHTLPSHVTTNHTPPAPAEDLSRTLSQGKQSQLFCSVCFPESSQGKLVPAYPIDFPMYMFNYLRDSLYSIFPMQANTQDGLEGFSEVDESESEWLPQGHPGSYMAKEGFEVGSSGSQFNSLTIISSWLS